MNTWPKGQPSEIIAVLLFYFTYFTSFLPVVDSIKEILLFSSHKEDATK